jgi:RNA polymerase sigma-70 factor (family 1)
MEQANQHAGHEDQFKSLFVRFKKPIHDYIRVLTGSHSLAEEITQVVFVRLWKKMDALHEIEHIDYYIFRIARNESMRYFRKAAVETQLFRDLQKRMTAENNNVAEYINYTETAAVLDKAIASLSPQRQKVYQLSRRQGLRIDEIAAEMKLSVNTVRNHLVEALRQIRLFYMNYLSVAVKLIIFLLICRH